MRKRLHLALMATPVLATSLFLTPPFVQAETGSSTMDGNSITPTEQDGRVIYTNDTVIRPALRRTPSSAAPQRALVFWSNTAHRWKPVPHASLSAARSAAAEVNQFMVGHPNAAANSEVGSVPPSGGFIRGSLVSAREIDSGIDDAAKRHNVDPNLVRAVIKVESNFNPSAVSRKGAMGLMQLMPSTARQLNVTNPFDPQQNVDAGVRHLKKLLENFGGDVRLSLAAYNAGAGAVQRSAGIPRFAETRNYVKRITELYSGGGPLLNTVGGPARTPVHVYRDEQGVLTFTNTD